MSLPKHGILHLATPPGVETCGWKTIDFPPPSYLGYSDLPAMGKYYKNIILRLFALLWPQKNNFKNLLSCPHIEQQSGLYFAAVRGNKKKGKANTNLGVILCFLWSQICKINKKAWICLDPVEPWMSRAYQMDMVYVCDCTVMSD